MYIYILINYLCFIFVCFVLNRSVERKKLSWYQMWWKSRNFINFFFISLFFWTISYVIFFSLYLSALFNTQKWNFASIWKKKVNTIYWHFELELNSSHSFRCKRELFFSSLKLCVIKFNDPPIKYAKIQYKSFTSINLLKLNIALSKVQTIAVFPVSGGKWLIK